MKCRLVGLPPFLNEDDEEGNLVIRVVMLSLSDAVGHEVVVLCAAHRSGMSVDSMRRSCISLPLELRLSASRS